MRECTCPSIESGSPLAFGKFPSKRSSIFLIDVVCFKESANTLNLGLQQYVNTVSLDSFLLLPLFHSTSGS